MSAFPIPQNGCVASGNNAIAWGNGSTATGFGSIAIGIGCVSAGTASVAIGNSVNALGDGAVAMGETCTASNPYSTAIGYLNTASSDYAVCMGTGNTISGTSPSSVALGTGNVINDSANPGFGGSSLALGEGNTCTNYLSVCIGKSNVASGDTSFAIGRGNTASGPSSFAFGDGCTANAFTASYAVGTNCTASGDWSLSLGHECETTSAAYYATARGDYAKSILPGQDSFSSGKPVWEPALPASRGKTQTSKATLNASTPGLGAGEVADLQLGYFEDGKAYAVRYTVLATAPNGGSPLVRMFSQNAVGFVSGGVLTIVDQNTLESIGSVGAASWTLTIATMFGGPGFRAAFSTGVTTHACHIVAKFEFTETTF
jgi:autotransporter adhesin